jgi:TolA-binding protein
MPTSRTATRRAAHGAVVAAALAVALACGCAYFNTFYNAKSEFKKAEQERAQSLGSGGLDSYQRCIDKCQLLLRYYPKSKYVDDALYLIGLSRLYRGEYVQARASLEELVQRFPKSEYVERAYYNMGIAALHQDDAAGAATAFGQLASEFPDSKLSVEAVFRSAEAKLDANDYEQAREELRAFLREHPKSDLVGEAQLRLARTYYDERRYEEARAEYDRVLQYDVEPNVRYESQLNSTLSTRALAEQTLANPTLQRASRMRRAATDLAQYDEKLSQPVDTGRNAVPPGGGVPPSGTRRPPIPNLPIDPQQEAMAREIAAAAESLGVDITGQESGLPDSVPGDSLPVADKSSRAADSTAAHLADSVTESVVVDTLPPGSLTQQDEKALQTAENDLDEVAKKLVSLRKPAARLNRQIELDIEIAVTRALQGQPGDAIADLDQIARLQPKSEDAARARYEIGEICRRLGDFGRARRAYDASLQEKPQSTVSERAQRQSTAIVAREQALEELKRAPKVLQRWNAEHAHATGLPNTTGNAAAAESLGAYIALETDFEELARQQLRIAEIDVLELDQPLVALREFQDVLTLYPGSLQGPRAAFGVAWIYHHRLRDTERAKQAYETVVQDYGESPQGREAREILDRWAQLGTQEVQGPSRP